MTKIKTTVTASNINDTRKTCLASDQARTLTVGCETWSVRYDGGKQGQMTRFPDGRGAVWFEDFDYRDDDGSEWGMWGEDGILSIRNAPLQYNEDGEAVNT